VKVAAGITRTHNPFDEDYWASCLRENLTSSSYGEGLETGREFAQEPRQSFTRQMNYEGSNQPYERQITDHKRRLIAEIRKGITGRVEIQEGEMEAGSTS
jgi:hypothetical protein